MVFTAFAAVVIVSSAMIAFSKNLVYSAFSLLGAFCGIAGLFVLLGADFLATIQVLVYVGGIMVLYLFAVLMTFGISDIKLSNPAVAVKIAIPACLILLALLAKLIYGTRWFTGPAPDLVPTTAAIGEALLTEYLLPFELISVLLLGTLVGAIAGARKEVK